MTSLVLRKDFVVDMRLLVCLRPYDVEEPLDFFLRFALQDIYEKVCLSSPIPFCIPCLDLRKRIARRDH